MRIKQNMTFPYCVVETSSSQWPMINKTENGRHQIIPRSWFLILFSNKETKKQTKQRNKPKTSPLEEMTDSKTGTENIQELVTPGSGKVLKKQNKTKKTMMGVYPRDPKYISRDPQAN